MVFFGLMGLSGVNNLHSQDSIYLLGNQLNRMDSTDPALVSETIKFCELIEFTEKAFLIPDYQERALLMAQEHKDTTSIIKLHSLAGDYFWRSGMYSEAANQFNQIRILAEGQDMPDYKALSSNGFGTVYYLMGDYETALSYYREGLQVVKNDSLLLMRLYNNVANAHIMLEQMDSVIYYYNKVLEYDLARTDLRRLSITYMNLAMAYDQMGQPEQARKMMGLAGESAEQSESIHQIAYVYMVMATFVSSRHPEVSLDLYQRSLIQASKARAFDLVLDNYESLSNYYVERGNKDSALYYLQAANILHDSLSMDRSARKVSEIETNFQWAKAQLEADRLVLRENLAKQEKENRQRIWLYVLIILVGALGIILFILFYTNLSKEKMNMELEASNQIKDKFFSLMAHDLRSPISGAIGLSQILEDEGKSIENSRLPYYARKLNSTLTEIKDLIENLLQWAQSESGRMSYEPESSKIKELADDAISLLTDISEAKCIVIHNFIPEDIYFDVDRNMFSTVFRNLISNGLKHTESGGEIRLEASLTQSALNVSIADTGTGIPPDKLQKLFDHKEIFTTPGTRKERGTGLGLLMCQEFVHQHKGTIEVNSEVNKGTIVKISLPII